ncbi:MAG: DUF1269 domain-containing protein [Anaerolineae bacterium]
MSKLVALIFDPQQAEGVLASMGGVSVNLTREDPSQALDMLKFLHKKAKEADVELEDAVVVYRTQQGEVKIKQTREVTAGKGAKRGSFWGLLVGVLLGGPVVGILGGMGLGALYGKLTDHGINDQFIKDVGQALKHNGSALMLMIKDEDYPRSIAYLKTFEFKILEADVSDETEQAVLTAAENDDVARAVE